MKREEINIRDPFVLTRNGQYYLYGTRGVTCWGPADGFDVYVSRDLENWDGPFECFHNDGTFWDRRRPAGAVRAAQRRARDPLQLGVP